MWKQIEYKNHLINYEISENGELRNFTTKQILKGNIKKTGYIEYNIYDIEHNKISMLAHRLVGFYYLDKPENINNKYINHIDGNKLNNNYTNLEWVDSSQNNLHSWDNNLNHAHVLRPVKQFTIDGQYIKTFPSITSAVEATGATKIRDVANGKRKSSGGYIWQWVEDFIPEDRGKSKKVVQLDNNFNIIAIFESVSEAARQTGANRKGISAVCLGKQKKCFNFYWKFVDDDIVH